MIIVGKQCFRLSMTQYHFCLQTPERDFTIKISGLEIYNENVRDLLNSESGRALKLLDDPEVSLICIFLLMFFGLN